MPPLGDSFGAIRLALAVGQGPAALRVGFVALTDAAPLVVARAAGLFVTEGVRVDLSAESSWAALRDRVAYGALDAAHMLNPMPIAAALGLGVPRHGLTVAAGLAVNGNTVVLSHALAAEIGPDVTAAAFGAALRVRASEGLPPPRLAVVFAHSSHNYLLRHWLAAGGVDPDRDVRLTVVPPPMMADALAAGRVDGFCAGEPWGSEAIARGAGRFAVATGDIWPDHPEKILVFAADAVRRAPDVAIRATAAVIRAARWLDDPANREAAATILRDEIFPALSVGVVAQALHGRVTGGTALRAPLRFRPATRPDPDRAAWWLSAMRRWGHLPHDADEAVALAPWRNPIWAEAAAMTGEAPPLPFPPAPEFPA